MQALKALVISLGFLILLAFGVLAYGIATKFGHSGDNNAVSSGFGETKILIPAGGRVLEMRPERGRLILRVRHANASESLLVVDLNTGQQTGTIHLDQRVMP